MQITHSSRMAIPMTPISEPSPILTLIWRFLPAVLLSLLLAGCQSGSLQCEPDGQLAQPVAPPVPPPVPPPAKPPVKPPAAPIPVPVPAQTQSWRLPILLYHHVADTGDADTTVSIALFASQMAYLKKNDYTPISLDEWEQAVSGVIRLPRKPVVITFDDAWEDQYLNALPILGQYGFRATFYAYPAVIGHPAAMSWQQLKSLASAGHSIGSHSLSHARLTRLNPGETADAFRVRIEHELTESKSQLEHHLGGKIEHFCYPYGYYSEEVIAGLQKAGYRTATTVNPMVNGRTTPAFVMGRKIVGAKATVSDLAQYLEWRPFEGIDVQPGNGFIARQEPSTIQVTLPGNPPWLPKTLKLWLDSRELGHVNWNPEKHIFSGWPSQPLTPGFHHLQIHARDAGNHLYSYSWRFLVKNDAAVKPPPLKGRIVAEAPRQP
jgi:peptidoglycan/xylan/chitin deacetylase (PgdA/CDA1 family)